ncbi:MAG: hypothetical protein CMK09_17735 [Ponticaulis sp.]|nr:hypothetical protein [Ponticaulis sp.]|tara:strand:+ start:1822 stop:2379 length:558 start_codon:yes stop_codon:yes gene_type:complete
MSIDKVIDSLPGMSAENREKLRFNAEAMRDNGKEAQASNAERVLQALIDVAVEEKQARYDELSTMSMAERVQDSFVAYPATKTEQKAIVTIVDNPGTSAGALTSIGGWKTQSWQFYFSAMCKKREAILWPDTPSDPQSPGALMQLLIDDSGENEGLSLKTDVEDMFRKMGFGKKKRKLAKVSATS